MVLVVIGIGWALLAGCQAQGNARVRSSAGPVTPAGEAASQAIDQIQAGAQAEEKTAAASTGAAHDLEQDLDSLEQALNQPLP